METLLTKEEFIKLLNTEAIKETQGSYIYDLQNYFSLGAIELDDEDLYNRMSNCTNDELKPIVMGYLDEIEPESKSEPEEQKKADYQVLITTTSIEDFLKFIKIDDRKGNRKLWLKELIKQSKDIMRGQLSWQDSNGRDAHRGSNVWNCDGDLRSMVNAVPNTKIIEMELYDNFRYFSIYNSTGNKTLFYPPVLKACGWHEYHKVKTEEGEAKAAKDAFLFWQTVENNNNSNLDVLNEVIYNLEEDLNKDKKETNENCINNNEEGGNMHIVTEKELEEALEKIEKEESNSKKELGISEALKELKSTNLTFNDAIGDYCYKTVNESRLNESYIVTEEYEDGLKWCKLVEQAARYYDVCSNKNLSFNERKEAYTNYRNTKKEYIELQNKYSN